MTPAEFKQARKRLGMTQAQLATRIDLHVKTVSRMERGVMAVAVRSALAVRLLVIESENDTPDDDSSGEAR